MKASQRKVAFGASVAAMAVLLGGCQALGIGGPRMARLAPAAETTQVVDLGAEQLAAGREALAAGRTADAIEAFMLAKTFPEQMPAAYNGLAVAYSRLGRTDLTERFFLTAVALAPNEDRYRANLATFYSRNGQPKIAEPALAIAPIQEVATPAPAVAVAAAAPVIRTLAGGVSVQTPATRLQRVSRGEVAIRTASASTPVIRAASTTRRPVIEVGASSRPAAYPVRVTLSKPQPAARTYPIRIPLSD